ncbi:hypothetical protein PYL79_22110, partial [Paenibacillus larvae subsp. larvae]|nr:hypothetical protein [Paenibacillus larvae subsp. larvae]
MNFHHLSIGKRLGLAFGLLTLFIIGMLAIGTWRLQSVAQDTAAMMNLPLAKERLISDWYRTIYSNVSRHALVARSSDTALAGRFMQENAAASRQSTEQQKQLARLISGPVE